MPGSLGSVLRAKPGLFVHSVNLFIYTCGFNDGKYILCVCAPYILD